MNSEEKQEYTLTLEQFKERTDIEDEEELLKEYNEYLENIQLLTE